MKISRVRTYHVRHELDEPFAYSQLACRQRDILLVELTTDEGHEGWGECYGPAAVCQAAVASFYGPLLMAQSPLETERLWHRMWRNSLDFARRGVMMAAISGLDMALWDLKGKILGRSASELMGGRFRDTVPGYATGMYFKELPEDRLLEQLVAEARDYHEQGFAAMKIKVGKNTPFDLRMIAAIREALPHVKLMADANHAFDLPEAVTIGRALEEHHFAWFEEPLSPEHALLYRQLHEKLAVPLAAGECEQTRYGFQSLLSAGGVHVAQPDLAYCGGPSEALKIRAVASSLGVNVVPHVWGTMLNLAAATHFLASGYVEPGRAESPSLLLECDRTPNALRDEIFSTPVALVSGQVSVPSSPGLGVTIDRAAMNSFLVQKTEIVDE